MQYSKEPTARALRRRQLKELRKLPAWDSLSKTDRHVATYLVRLMTHPRSGEVFKNERALCTLIPPAPTKRGRPNTSGHISRMTLRASLTRLEAAGIFTSWRTLGKRVSQSSSNWIRNGRTPAIRVWRLSRTAWSRAWATVKRARADFGPGNSRPLREGSSRGVVASQRSKQRDVDTSIPPPTLLDLWRSDPVAYASDLTDLARAA
jgi:hypothetical protein